MGNSGGGPALISTPERNFKEDGIPVSSAFLEPSTVSWSVIAMAPRLILRAISRISDGVREPSDAEE